MLKELKEIVNEELYEVIRQEAINWLKKCDNSDALLGFLGINYEDFKPLIFKHKPVSL